MLTSSSHFSRTKRRMPSPSAPMTRASLRSIIQAAQIGGRLARRAVNPDVVFLELVHQAGQVLGLGHRQVTGRSGGGLGDHRRERGAAAFFHDHTVRAQHLGAADDRTEVARVGDAVEQNDQQLLALLVGPVQNVVHRRPFQVLDFGQHALMLGGSGELIEFDARRESEAHIEGFEFAHEAFLDALGDQEFGDAPALQGF